MASISAGKDRLKRSLGWLCHNVEPWCRESQLNGRNSVIVSQVLKYSLNCVMIPLFTVHTCTQYTLAPSQPSTTTRSSMTFILRGSNLNSLYGDFPVRTRIIWWQFGGPWNHHSRSFPTTLVTFLVSPFASAL